MQPIIQTTPAKTLIGMSINMSMTDNKTGLLFRTFMPRKKEITNLVNADTYDLRVYTTDYHQRFDPRKEFIKWALAEVSSAEEIPEGMSVFTLSAGLYAMFPYRGVSSDPRIFQYIFTEWLPKSNYQLDDRPHFEVMGAKTKLNDPNSEEEIWIPIK